MDSHWPTPGREVNDCVYLKDLQVSAIVGPDAWGRQGQIQPVLISVKCKMTKDITGSMKENYDSFTSAHALADYIYQVAVLGNWNGLALSVQVHLPKAVLHANKGLKYISHYQMKELESGRMAFTEDQLYPKTLIEDVKLLCIIGVNDHERLAKQSVRVNLVIEEDLTLFAESGIDGNWRGLVKQAAEIVEGSSFQTVEALACQIASTLLSSWPARMISVSVEKPSAQPFVGASGAQVTRFKI